ncbi:MAG TPA: serine hydrolase [Longimicrobiales bacterium]|nr:serine hydrolase [Longimicrobiales bacterium]
MVNPLRSPSRLAGPVALLLPLLVSAGACAARSAGPAPGAGTTLIRGALVLDGTGAPGAVADVRIADGRIASTAAGAPVAGEAVIDGAGLVLAPGFIDTHSHHDRGLLDLPDALGAVSQGITTIVVGNDGGSPFPLADFLRRVGEAGVAVNVASYAGHGTIRRQVMGEDFRREATPAEVAGMRRLLKRELDAGALGLSTGLEYDPGIYASTEEVIALARDAAAAGGRYISHVRSEDRALWDAIDEVIRIGREADIPVQVSHMKLAMKSLWGRAGELIARLDRARAEGVDITADVYPYTYWQSTMTVLFPERDFQDREAASFALGELAPPEGMLIARYEPEPAYEGRTLADVARERREDPVTAYLALVQRAVATDGGESIIATSMRDDDVARLIRWPHTNISSDGALAGAHPRGFGAFTRVLGSLVREGPLSLEEAVHKMTGLSAAHVGLEDRGVLRAGAPADLVLFDPATVTDRATPADPHAPSEGVRIVWVNGEIVYRDGRTTGATPGAILRRAGTRVEPRTTSGAAAPAAAGEVPIARIDSVFAAYDDTRSPGCAVGVFRDGALAFARGYGMADLEHGVPLSETSVFRIGSVSKQFSAAAMVLLAQDGAISLDDPVRRWIPELPDFGPRFTVRSLIHHTSGVRDYLTLMTLAGKRDDDWYSDDDVVAMLARQTAPNFDPGSEHLYSNSGYFLLSRIVKRAAGKTLAQYARERMFEPLGMLDTHFHDDPTRIVARRAIGHAPAPGGGYRISTTTLPMVGDGGIFTSIRDLLLWDRNLDAGAAVGGPAFLAALHRPGVLTSGDTLDYAFGLVHGTQRGIRTVSHGGAFVGFRAASLRYPDERVSIYTLCNRADADPAGLGRQVGEVVLGERMAPPTPETRRARAATARVDTLPVSPALAAATAGHYHADELDASYRIVADGTALRLEVGNGLDGPLARIGDDTFRRGGLTLRFQRDGAARVTGFLLDAGRVRGLRFRRAGG